MKKLNIMGAFTGKISVALITGTAVREGKAKIIYSDITPKQFENIAQRTGFSRTIKDSSLLGYRYVNDLGITMVSYPPIFKKGEMVSI